MFEAIEEEDKAIEKDEGLPPALLGSCNDRAKQLHASPSGLLLIPCLSLFKYEYLIVFFFFGFICLISLWRCHCRKVAYGIDRRIPRLGTTKPHA